jgi:hypothetical protein
VLFWEEEKMTAENDYKFDWKEFLRHVKCRDVIPFIGKQLYRVDIESEGKSNQPLYKYLAEVVSDKCKKKPPEDKRDRFPIACEYFLKENNEDHRHLSEILQDQLQKISLIQANPLRKLARIRSFDFFMNTTYDDFLLQTLKNVRTSGTDAFLYTKSEKRYKSRADGSAPHPNSNPNLVFNIFGNFENTSPAYSEQSIVDAIISFHRNIENGDLNSITHIERLVNRQLLFLGCEYDDWLFRYLICIISSKVYDLKNPNFKLLLGDDLKNNPREPFQELLLFLKKNKVVDFYPTADGNFVDLLFERMAEEHIIQPEEYPGKVFISFEGRDRPAAQRLTDRLREDGIDVWLDEDNLRGGDKVNETIINAINKCPAFIPLNSKHAIQKEGKKGKLKYHIQEWEYAYAKYINDKKEFEDNKKWLNIIPVVLDNKDHIYEKFENFYGYKIPNGTGENYEKLREDLQKIQSEYHG